MHMHRHFCDGQMDGPTDTSIIYIKLVFNGGHIFVTSLKVLEGLILLNF